MGVPAMNPCDTDSVAKDWLDQSSPTTQPMMASTNASTSTAIPPAFSTSGEKTDRFFCISFPP